MIKRSRFVDAQHPEPGSGTRVSATVDGPRISGRGLTDLIESLAEPAEIATLEGGVLAVNQALSQLLGWDGGLPGAEPGVLGRQSPETIAAIAERLRESRRWRGTVTIDSGGVASPTAATSVALLSKNGELAAVLTMLSPPHPVPSMDFHIYESSPVMMHSIDESGRIVAVNRVWLDRLGYAESDVIGRHIDSLTTPASAERVRQELPRFWHLGTVCNLSLQFVRGDGSFMDVVISSDVVRDTSGRRLGLSVVTDVTAQKQVEREHARLAAQLEQVRRIESLGRLAGGIAHDFNNMLAVILNYAELALKKLPPDSPAVPAIMQVCEGAQRSSELTRQLLVLSRRQVLDPEVTSPVAVIECLRPALAATCGPTVDVQIELSPDTWKVGLGRSQLEQILLNLAANSRDAMPDGGSFAVRTANMMLDEASARGQGELKPGRHVQIEVRDTGCGMPEDVAAHVFEPFYTTKNVGDGTGLGLSIIYGIVTQAGGQVTLRSETGRGATFTLWLPAVDVRPGATPPPPAADTRPPPHRILVVDDEHLLRRSVSRMLAESGFVVLQAADGASALDVLDGADPVDVVLTDVVMPAMNGIELAQRVRERHGALPVVFMSGYAYDAIRAHGLDPANVRLLQKPFTKAQLLQRLEEVLAAASARA